MTLSGWTLSTKL